MKRIPELDGLRALAITLVILSHCYPHEGTLKWLAPVGDLGWIGVDLFFVLSGYLITGILVRSAGKQHYYRNFVARRALRIFPLYYTCLIVFTASVWLSSDHAKWQALSQWGGPGWFFLYIANFRAFVTDWMAPVVIFAPFWSLQVEEQFYLVWPAVVAMLAPVSLRRFLIGCTIGAALIRVLCGNLAHGALACYLLTPCRMDALALGALVAVSRYSGPVISQRAYRLLFLAGAVGTSLVFCFVSTSPYHWLVRTLGYSLLDMTFAALLGCILSSPDLWFARLLRWRPLTYTGKVSYGLYVLHAPAAWIARSLVSRVIPVPAHSALAIPVTFGSAFIAAGFSWRYFESSFLRLKDRFAPDRRAGSDEFDNDNRPVLTTDSLAHPAR